MEQEAARDLVRAREDCRGDLMRSRHRLSKLLLRHGHRVLRRAARGPGRTRSGCARQRFALAGRCRWRSTPRYETVLLTTARRDRLDTAIAEMAADSEFTPVVRRLGCLRGVSHADRVRVGRGDRRLAPVHRLHRSARSSG